MCPFCVSKCAYCDFASYAGREADIPHYLDAVVREITRRGAETGHPKANTIFLGGGTPSLLDEFQVTRILDALGKAFQIEKGAEITCECNPGTLGIPPKTSNLYLGSANPESKPAPSRKKARPSGNAPVPRDPDLPHWLPTGKRLAELPPTVHDAIPRIIAPAYRDEGRQRSIYLGGSDAFVEKVRQALAALQGPRSPMSPVAAPPTAILLALHARSIRTAPPPNRNPCHKARPFPQHQGWLAVPCWINRPVTPAEEVWVPLLYSGTEKRNPYSGVENNDADFPPVPPLGQCGIMGMA